MSGVKSELILRVAMPERLGVQLAENLDLLPRRCLVPHNSIHISRAYRSYLGRAAYQKGKLNSELSVDLTVKTFLRCMNLKSL